MVGIKLDEAALARLDGAAKAAALRALGSPCPASVDITTPEERIFTQSPSR